MEVDVLVMAHFVLNVIQFFLAFFNIAFLKIDSHRLIKHLDT